MSLARLNQSTQKDLADLLATLLPEQLKRLTNATQDEIEEDEELAKLFKLIELEKFNIQLKKKKNFQIFLNTLTSMNGPLTLVNMAVISSLFFPALIAVGAFGALCLVGFGIQTYYSEKLKVQNEYVKNETDLKFAILKDLVAEKYLTTLRTEVELAPARKKSEAKETQADKKKAQVEDPTEIIKKNNAVKSGFMMGTTLLGYYIGSASILNGFGVVVASTAMLGGLGLGLAFAAIIGFGAFCCYKHYRSIKRDESVESTRSGYTRSFKKMSAEIKTLEALKKKQQMNRIASESEIKAPDEPTPKATRNHADSTNPGYPAIANSVGLVTMTSLSLFADPTNANVSPVVVTAVAPEIERLRLA